jgi:uncharacterized LabA/DUF88 family protein
VSRVSVFIDGYNLYYGLRAKHDRAYLWLDLVEMARGLLEPGQELEGVHYFTAIVHHDPVSYQNQQVYLAALRARGGIDIVLGRYQEKQADCRECGANWRIHEEKETDVNIAVALLAAGVRDAFDTAILLSADGDLCPGVRTLKELVPDKRVIAAFPPRRRSDDLRRAADGSVSLGDAVLRRCLLPDVVADGDGGRHRRPDRWH